MTAIKTILISSLSLSLMACGKSGGVTLNSSASASMSLTELNQPLTPQSNLVPGTEFKLCIKSIKFEAEDGEAQEKEGESEISLKLGLINLTDNDTQKITWGKIEDLPVGYKLKKIKIKIHKDSDLCGVDYSIKYGSDEFDKDVEFKFKFENAMDLSDGSSINLQVANLINTIASNAPAGAEAIKEAVEALEEEAKED